VWWGRWVCGGEGGCVVGKVGVWWGRWVCGGEGGLALAPAININLCDQRSTNSDTTRHETKEAKKTKQKGDDGHDSRSQ